MSLPEKGKEAVVKLRHLMKTSTENDLNSLYAIIEKLTLADLNRVLYRCDQEERDEGKGFASYDVPDYGTLVYCGIQGKSIYIFLLFNRYSSIPNMIN